MKSTKAALVIGLGICLCASVFSVSAQDTRKGIPFQADPVRGYETSTKLCAACHIIGRKQTGTTQPGVPSFMYLANKPEQTQKNLEITMIHPPGSMIDAQLTNHEIKDISVYILSLKSSE